MSVSTKLTSTCTFLLTAFFVSTVSAQSFNLKTIPLGHPANGDILELDHTLAVSGHASDNRWLSLVDRKEFSATAVAVPDNAQFFSKMTLAGKSGEQLVFLTTEGIGVYNQETAETQLLLEIESLHPVVDRKRLPHLDITHDINDSGLSDLLIPDFTAYHLLVQKSDGTFARFRLPIEAEVQMWGTEPHFKPRKPYVIDMNLDEKKDVVFIRDGQMVVFLQQADRSFAQQAQVIAPGMTISLDNEAQVRTGEGRSFDDLLIHRVHDLTDLDGDDLTDLIIRREKYSSAVEQDYNYRIHYGQRSEKGLVFSPEPNAHINTRGIQFESIFADINGDGRKDFYTPSASFGAGTIIRALISGSANLDIQFYLMKDDRSFNDRPDHNHKATAQVSIGRGSVDLPLVQVASTTGSARKDLILGENEDRLRVHRGEDEQRLFAQSAARFNTPLPRDGARVKVIDVNNDGFDDLVLPFDAQDNEATRNQLRILLTQ